MENKNILFAFVLMFLVWTGVNYLFPSSPSTPLIPHQATEETAPVDDPAQRFSVVDPEERSDLGAEETMASVAEVRNITVKTGRFEAIFTSVGGRLQSLKLPEFRQSTASDALPVALVDVAYPLQATLSTEGLGDFDLSSEAVYAVSTDQDLIELSAGDEQELIFTTRTLGGLKVEKIYRFRGDAFDFDLRVRVTNLGGVVLRGSTSLGLVHPWDPAVVEESEAIVHLSIFDGDKVQSYDFEDLQKNTPSYGSEAFWTAFQRKYFMAAAVALEDAGDRFHVRKSGDLVESRIDGPFSILSPDQTLEKGYLLFFGPRDPDILEQAGHELVRAIDFGFFGIIARPLLSVLKFFQGYVGNWGVAIILLTCIIKILFWPLTQKSYKSMKAMQSLQPQMQKLREKYKNNKEQLNKEIMELYRSNRVNPMGGCLPMLVQIPVFFALYKVLLGTIALRHAPFVFWIQDLSVKDPYYITPLIMGATMFVQQRMTPSTMDPVQAKMFMFMPIIFTFMFLNFPAGLVLYWMVNNLLTILQQWLVNRPSPVET